MPEISFFYVDIGRPGYTELATGFVESVRAKVPGAFVSHLTCPDTPPIAGIDSLVRLDVPITADNLMLARTAMYAKQVRRAHGPIVFCDCDLRWNKPPVFGEDWDIGVLYRAGQPAMPYLGAMTYVTPNEAAIDWFAEVDFLARSMPRKTHNWWCDQFAVALILGLHGRPGDILKSRAARVAVFDAYEHAFTPTYDDQECRAVAIHFKGIERKKQLRERDNAD